MPVMNMNGEIFDERRKDDRRKDNRDVSVEKRGKDRRIVDINSPVNKSNVPSEDSSIGNDSSNPSTEN